ncbi:unnamed protein product [Mortierella alpina]
MDYLEKATQADKAGDGTDGMLPSMRAYVDYCEGHPEKAHRQLADAINESKSFGVVSNLATYYRAVTMKCAYRMWEGSFNVHPEDSALLRAMSAVAIQMEILRAKHCLRSPPLLISFCKTVSEMPKAGWSLSSDL